MTPRSLGPEPARSSPTLLDGRDPSSQAGSRRRPDRTRRPPIPTAPPPRRRLASRPGPWRKVSEAPRSPGGPLPCRYAPPPAGIPARSRCHARGTRRPAASRARCHRALRPDHQLRRDLHQNAAMRRRRPLCRAPPAAPGRGTGGASPPRAILLTYAEPRCFLLQLARRPGQWSRGGKTLFPPMNNVPSPGPWPREVTSVTTPSRLRRVPARDEGRLLQQPVQRILRREVVVARGHGAGSRPSPRWSSLLECRPASPESMFHNSSCPERQYPDPAPQPAASARRTRRWPSLRCPAA